jgi:hypothetical protein
MKRKEPNTEPPRPPHRSRKGKLEEGYAGVVKMGQRGAKTTTFKKGHYCNYIMEYLVCCECVLLITQNQLEVQSFSLR